MDCIKVDAEGCETAILSGASCLIAADRPVMVIEVNRPALLRQGSSPRELMAAIAAFDYDLEPVPEGTSLDSEQYDLLCRPR